jgi:hypothetical protein
MTTNAPTLGSIGGLLAASLGTLADVGLREAETVR